MTTQRPVGFRVAIAVVGRGSLLAVFLVSLGSCDAAEPIATAEPTRSSSAALPSDQPDPWSALRRPINRPSFDLGCRPDDGASLHPAIARGFGRGPVYAVINSATATFALGEIRPDYRGWYALKILWVADPSYGGLALVRGARLDADGEVMFNGSSPELTLRATTAASGDFTWRQWNSAVYIREPGCYFLQVDTDASTDTVTFEALP